MKKTLVLGAGCFWGVEEKFSQLEGVLNTEVGYAGGHTKNPSYEEICQKNTNHAEVVKVIFDDNKISFEKILEFFFKIHNPTTINRQGVDIGNQYRSVIFINNEDEKQAAESFKQKLQEKLYKKQKIATQIEILPNYYQAEDYHQKYIQKKNQILF